MCGFAGVFALGPDAKGRAYQAELIERMTDTVAHRGPDACGHFVDERVALGHRRLSILDLSACGSQPMRLGSATLVYNGEAYNFRDLRRRLEAEGCTFRGSSDTEVVLTAYRQWGLHGLRQLEGMFSFALWDAAAQRLILMRDRLGIKPLYYAASGGRVAFGSEIKAVRAAGAVSGDIDTQALAEYLWYGNAFEDRTLYRDVRSLLPGHWLIIEHDEVRVECWWRLEEWLAPNGLNEREAAEAVRSAVDSAVARQLVSDVPVALFLSGGIDSSSIAASAALGSGRRLTSYAVAFDYDTHANELPRARLTARRFGLEHHELHVAARGLEDVIHALVEAHDEPFADAANIPLFLLCRELKGAATVVLQGDGGDEMFAGYRRYSVLSRSLFWRAWPAWSAGALEAAGGATGRRLARMGAAAGHPDPALRMALLLTVETLRDPPWHALAPAARCQLMQATDPFLAFRRSAARFADADPVQMMLLTDLTLQLPSQFLPKVDRATMAHGIEARVPLLDETVARVAVGMPASFKVRGGERKRVLRAAFRGAVPDEILDGPKTGFGVPYEQWIAGPLHAFAREAVLERGVIERFDLDPIWIARAFEDHRIGRRDRGFLLWKLLQLALWSRRFLS